MDHKRLQSPLPYRVITSWLNRSQPARLPHPAPRLIVFPYATLFYVLAYSPVSGGVGGWGWIFVVLGFVSTSGTGSAPLRRQA